MPGDVVRGGWSAGAAARWPGRLLLAGAALLAGCGGGPVRMVHPPNLRAGERLMRYDLEARLFQVANGMRLMVLPDANTNLVKVDVRYLVGASEDPDGKSGLAHMVEHMTYRLRPGGPDGPTLSDRLGDVALFHNAYTTWDETHYTAVALREQLAALLALESARMTGACDELDEASFAHEREVVRNEVRWRAGVASAGHQLLRDEVYGPGHAYHRYVGGSDRELAALSLADVCAFLADHYAPDRAIVVVSGNASADYVARIAEPLFGAIATRARGRRAPVERPVLRGTASRHELSVEEATALIVLPAAPAMSDGAAAERLLVRILKERLARLMVERPHITSVVIGTAGGQRAPVLVVAVSVTWPTRLPRVVDEVFARMAGVADSFDADALVTLREEQRASLLRSVEPFMSEAALFTDYLQHADHKRFVIQDLDDLAAVELGGLKERARRLFQRSSSHVVMIYPNRDATPAEQRAAVSFTSEAHEPHDRRAPGDPEAADRALPIPERQARPEVRSFTLDNGLEVLLVPALDYPVVDIRLVYRAGGLHDPPDKPGLALLAMNLLQNSVPRVETRAQLFALEAIFKMGGDFARYMDERTTTFRATGLAMYLDALLWRLHWLLEKGVYDGAALSRWNEIASRRAAPSAKKRREALQTRAMLAGVYGADHPYVRASDKPRITVSDLERFRGRHYRMNGATLIMTGKFDGDFAEAEVRRLFSWGGGPAAPPVPRVPPGAERTRPRYLAGYDEERLQTEITIAFGTRPAFGRAHAARAVLLEMVEARLSALRESLGATYGASVEHRTRAGAGMLLIAASVDRERAGEAFRAMLAALSGLRTEDIRADFARARKRVLQRALASTTDSASVARELEYVVTYELPRDYFAELAGHVATLRPEEVRGLIASELAERRQVVLAQGRRASVEAMYGEVGITDYRVIGGRRAGGKPRAVPGG